MNTSQLFNWKDEINRREYLVWGLIFFTIKYNLDRLTAFVLDRTWYITDYLIQADKLTVEEMNGEDNTFYLILLLQSIPFIYVGTVLTVKRLRNANLPTWLVIFFFIPFVNFILFIILSAMPENARRMDDFTRTARDFFGGAESFSGKIFRPHERYQRRCHGSFEYS